MSLTRGTLQNQQIPRNWEGAKKERKPASQAATGIHGKYDKCGLGFGGFVQLGHNEIKAEAAFGDSVAALNRVALAGILVHLALELRVRFFGTSAAQRED